MCVVIETTRGVDGIGLNNDWRPQPRDSPLRVPEGGLPVVAFVSRDVGAALHVDANHVIDGVAGQRHHHGTW